MNSAILTVLKMESLQLALDPRDMVLSKCVRGIAPCMLTNHATLSRGPQTLQKPPGMPAPGLPAVAGPRSASAHTGPLLPGEDGSLLTVG